MARKPMTEQQAEREVGMVNRKVPVALIDAHPDNPNEHPDDQVEAIAESLKELGQFRSVVLVEQGNGRYTAVAGHGVIQGAVRQGLEVVKADVHPASTPPERVREMLLADNGLAERSQMDEVKLTTLLEERQSAGGNLRMLGYSAEHLADLHERIAARALAAGEAWTAGQQDDDEAEGIDPEERDEADDPFTDAPGDAGEDGEAGGEAGVLLSKLDLALVTPRHRVERGTTWRVGHHVLCVVDVFRKWAIWEPWLARQSAEALADDPPRRVVFAPFPGPFLALSQRAQVMRFVLVQPDPLIAAHVIDRYADIYGEASVERLTPVDG